MSELISKEEAATRAREVIVDTGCNWREAASKVLEGVRLSSEDRHSLLEVGLAQFARSSLNRPHSVSNHRETPSVTSAEELLEPIHGFLAMGRVFQVKDQSKPFLECDSADLGVIIEALDSKRKGLVRNIKFIMDVRTECERFKCKVKELPTFHLLEEKAPW